jgi:hypothetical protein
LHQATVPICQAGYNAPLVGTGCVDCLDFFCKNSTSSTKAGCDSRHFLFIPELRGAVSVSVEDLTVSANGKGEPMCSPHTVAAAQMPPNARMVNVGEREQIND